MCVHPVLLQRLHLLHSAVAALELQQLRLDKENRRLKQRNQRLKQDRKSVRHSERQVCTRTHTHKHTPIVCIELVLLPCRDQAIPQRRSSKAE